MEELNYKKTGSGKPVILLHGWGCDLSIFSKLQESLQRNFTVYAIDFNGFGESPEPASAWGTEEYAQSIEYFMEQENISNPTLIGHSFGGRVAILMASRIKINKLILVGSAGLKPQRKPAYYFKIYTFKILKNILSLPILKIFKEDALNWYTGNAGSEDYKNASVIMKKVLSKVVNEDLKPILKKIKAPTLLMWGENDTATPISDAKIMEQEIPDAGLVNFKNAGHYCFLEKATEFDLIVNKFLEEDL